MLWLGGNGEKPQVFRYLFLSIPFITKLHRFWASQNCEISVWKGPASGGGASGTRMREVACPTCTVHLQVCQKVTVAAWHRFLCAPSNYPFSVLCPNYCGCGIAGSGSNIWLRDSWVWSVPACLPCQRQLIHRGDSACYRNYSVDNYSFSIVLYT